MPMSEENRKKAGERLKAARLAKKALAEAPSEITTEHEIIDQNLSLADTVAQLQSQIQELLAEKKLDRAAEVRAENPSMSDRGSLIGTFERYITAADFYPDPCERLALESRLARFAFGMNYELKFAVTTDSFTTIDNVRTREPRFTIELIRIILDEDTGEQTNQRYVVCRGIFHEDPDAAIEVARRMGIEIGEMSQRDFLNEMRYMQMRDWLLEAFYPPKSDEVQAKREIVIGNKLVEVFEVSSEVGAATPKIPFGEMSRKL